MTKLDWVKADTGAGLPGPLDPAGAGELRDAVGKHWARGPDEESGCDYVSMIGMSSLLPTRL